MKKKKKIRLKFDKGISTVYIPVPCYIYGSDASNVLNKILDSYVLPKHSRIEYAYGYYTGKNRFTYANVVIYK